MAVEGVMVTYNYSEDGEYANILTVSASGIRFSKRWVLTHGSILSPLKEAKIIKKAKGKPILSDEFYANLPEMHVTCEKKQSINPNLYESVEKLSRERNSQHSDLDHSSYLIRVLTGRICHVWQCPILDRCADDILYSWTIGHRDGDIDSQMKLGNALFSVFVLIDLESDKRGVESLRPLSYLLDVVRAPTGRGSTLEVHSTPFGCEVFLNAITRGSICGVVGKRPSLLLTDAATALGSEGGPVFNEGPTKELIGTVVCSVSWCRGEWVGLTLVAPLISVLSAKLRVAPPQPARPLTTHPLQDVLSQIDDCTILVRCGHAWGAGVYLGGGFVVTCAHVVKSYQSHKLSVYCRGVSETAIVRYKTPDKKAYDLALLFTNPERLSHMKPAILSKVPAEKGESVLAAGFPYYNEFDLTNLIPTITSGHVNTVSPSMVQTSCCVQSGFSGGPIFRVTGSNNLVEVIGIIAINVTSDGGACFPYVNMAVPVTVFSELLAQYILDKDESKLTSIENNKDIIQSQWRLMPYRSKI
ncbi:peroxisomal leader peptide-processing protease-like [Trichoplusia ni]|uniref:Peroxisomal leader peptide-processing protease n=1 Tax=Trichoplusia ni TaxID=7111 RepID=A0A7E5WSK4_TRINI|nr:peroxisomal leader peptide-processing protease-like [Trichoplusia ni]XP_026743799.1 peroxisomal leader peptide-processing protease-like [Trichoplusia ni]